MLALKKATEPYYAQIPISDISPALYQPRRYFESIPLDELSRSIKRYGVLQPILVRKTGKRYEVIAGERRIRAAYAAGLTKIPAIVCNFTDREAVTCGILENLHRENLNFLDLSDSYVKLSEMENYNLPSLAFALCKSDDAVESKLRFKRFSQSIRRLISYHKISEEHAKLVLRLGSDEKREKVIKKIVENGYSVSQTDELVEKILIGEMPTIQSKKKYGNGDLRLFKNTLKQTVNIMRKSGMKTFATEADTDGYFEYTIRVEKAKQHIDIGFQMIYNYKKPERML